MDVGRSVVQLIITADMPEFNLNRHYADHT